MGRDLIITHADADGMCAGPLLLSKFPNAKVFFSKPVSLYRDLQEISGYDRIAISDIALTRRDAALVIEALKRMDCEKLYFDHHRLPSGISRTSLASSVGVLANGSASASELVYRHFQTDLPRERVWLALYGAIADYEADTDFVEERLRNWDARAIYFEVSSLVLGIKNDRFGTYDAKRRIIMELARGKNPSDVRGLVQKASEAVTREFELYNDIKGSAKSIGRAGYVMDIHTFGFRGPAALMAATVTGRPIGLSIHTRGDHADITARSREKIDLGRLMERLADKVGGSGGGHPGAAGARIPRDKVREFLRLLG